MANPPLARFSKERQRLNCITCLILVSSEKGKRHGIFWPNTHTRTHTLSVFVSGLYDGDSIRPGFALGSGYSSTLTHTRLISFHLSLLCLLCLLPVIPIKKKEKEEEKQQKKKGKETKTFCIRLCTRGVCSTSVTSIPASLNFSLSLRR